MTIHYAYALGPLVVLGGGAFSYERGNPVQHDAPAEARGPIRSTARVSMWRIGRPGTEGAFNSSQGHPLDGTTRLCTPFDRQNACSCACLTRLLDRFAVLNYLRSAHHTPQNGVSF